VTNRHNAGGGKGKENWRKGGGTHTAGTDRGGGMSKVEGVYLRGGSINPYQTPPVQGKKKKK